MTKKLEELFNIGAEDQPVEETPDTTETMESIAYSKEMLENYDTAIDKIDMALPTVNDLSASDTEMDALATMAQENFNNLMDLGMNVDSRYSGTIFQTAGMLLGHAITAKQAKLDKKIKMVELQLKKASLDFKEKELARKIANDTKASSGDDDDAVEGTGQLLDRAALMQEIMKNMK